MTEEIAGVEALRRRAARRLAEESATGSWEESRRRVESGGGVSCRATKSLRLCSVTPPHRGIGVDWRRF